MKQKTCDNLKMIPEDCSAVKDLFTASKPSDRTETEDTSCDKPKEDMSVGGIYYMVTVFSTFLLTILLSFACFGISPKTRTMFVHAGVCSLIVAIFTTISYIFFTT